MSRKLLDELSRELGADAGFLAPLSEQELASLRDAIGETRRRQKQALDRAVDKGLGMAPLLLRGALKRVLFP